jgi:riboflavin kinase/FMN adenylyltransferase
MELRRTLEDVPPARRSLALGSFDGVHLGHRQVIDAAVAHARTVGATATVVTFYPHPMSVLRPELPTFELSTLERRAGLTAELGVDELVVIPFTRELSLVEPDAFATDVLGRRLGAQHITVGENFRFGHRARGTTETLRRAGNRLGFEVTVIPLLELQGAPVSSSRIRDLIGAGRVEAAGELLGRPPWLEGIVVRGDGRGRGLGFPTANLAPPPRSVVAGGGIYAGRAHLPGSSHTAAISVGYNPTFTDARGAVRVEAHLLDFDRDIYDSPIRIELAHRLRDEERYGTVEDLIEQLGRDVARTRELMADGAVS